MKPEEYSEAEVQQIIARAVQLDTSAPDRLRLDQLRAIATELGISSSALDRALQEHGSSARMPQPVAGTAPTSSRPRWYRRRRSVAMLIAATLLAVSAGLAMTRLVPHEEPADVWIEVGGP